MSAAMTAYEKKDYKTALKNWMKAGDLKDGLGAYNVGAMFENDLGIDAKMFPNAKRKLIMATIWYLTAARLKNADGAIRLAMLFHDAPVMRTQMMVRRITKVYHRNMTGGNVDVINAYGVVLETKAKIDKAPGNASAYRQESWAAYRVAAERGAETAAESAARMNAQFSPGDQKGADRFLTNLRKKLRRTKN